jgi:hypothetical protein
VSERRKNRHMVEVELCRSRESDVAVFGETNIKINHVSMTYKHEYVYSKLIT